MLAFLEQLSKVYLNKTQMDFHATSFVSLCFVEYKFSVS